MKSKFDLTGDQICLGLDRLTEHYRNRLKLADKRWDWLQDERKIEEDSHGESDRCEKLHHLCYRAEKQVSEMQWRLEKLKVAYDALEQIEMSIDKLKRKG